MTRQNDFSCPIQNADRRLADGLAHLVEMKKQYFNPDAFRRALNSAVQELRNVTFVLQKTKAEFESFDLWYGEWRRKMREDPLMKWLVDARNIIVKQGDLETHSAAVISVVESWLEVPKAHFEAPLFLTTEEIAQCFYATKPKEISLDVGLLRVERRWVHSKLPDHEILEALAHSYGVLCELILDAHKALIQQYAKRDCKTFQVLKAAGGRLPPCMIAQDWDRTVWMNLHDGTIMSPGRRIMQPSAADLQKAADTYSKSQEVLERLRKASSFKDLAGAWFEQAKNILCTDGYHHSCVLLGYPDGKMVPVSVVMADRTVKHWQIYRLASEIAKTGADSIVFINEIWLSQRPDLYRYAVDDPNRDEGLQMVAANSKGEVFVHTVMFARDVDGKILLKEDSPVESRTPNIMKPIIDVWK